MTKNESNFIKGIAILLMIFYHLYYSNDCFFEYNLNGMIGSEETMRLMVHFGHVCVPIYAFLTGYGFTKKEKQKQIQSQIKKYIALVYDLFFVITCILAINGIIKSSFSIKDLWGENKLDIVIGVVSNSVGLAGIMDVPWLNSSWWYISLYLYFIFIFPVIYMVMKKLNLGTSIGLAILVPNILKLNVVNDTFGRYFPAFYLGMIFAEYEIFEKIKNRINNKSKSAVYAVVCVGMLWGLVAIRSNFEKQYLIETILAICTITFGIILYDLSGVFHHVLVKIGKNSMYMWLIHVFIYEYWINIWSWKLKNIWLIWLIVCLATFCVAFLLAELRKQIFVLYKRYTKC